MKEKIHEILDLCLEIQMRGYGEKGFPFVCLQVSNYGYYIHLYAMDKGFSPVKKYDLDEELDSNFTQEEYDHVIEYLKNLLQIAVEKECERCS